jgi:hypothetical protein
MRDLCEYNTDHYTVLIPTIFSTCYLVHLQVETNYLLLLRLRHTFRFTSILSVVYLMKFLLGQDVDG